MNVVVYRILKNICAYHNVEHFYCYKDYLIKFGYEQNDTSISFEIWPRNEKNHDDVIKWKHFPRSWPFVRGTHRSQVNFTHKVRCRGTLMFSLICAWINGWANNREADDWRRHRAYYEVTVMWAPNKDCYMIWVCQDWCNLWHRFEVQFTGFHEI